MRIDKQKIQCAMARKLLDVDELAKKTGLARGTLYKAMQGNSPRLKTIGQIAIALGVDVAEITVLE